MEQRDKQTEGQVGQYDAALTPKQDGRTQDGTAATPQGGATNAKQQSEGLRAPSKWAVFIILALGVFMATLDSSIVNISLPVIARQFGVPLNGAVEWVIIAYLVVTAAILLTAGRVADMIGRKAVWIIGLVVFTGGSALCGAAPTLGWLIAARGLQGLGGALLFATSPAMLTSAFPPQERGRALGLNAVNVALGVSVGPPLGGFLTGISWRLIFYVNVPIGIIAIIATFVVLKEKVQRNPGKFDPLGAVLLAVGLAALTASLSFGQEIGWSSPLLIAGLVIGVLSLLLLPFVESRVSNPVIDFRLLQNRVFLSSNVSLLISFLSLFAVSFIMPFYLENLRGLPTEQVGLLLTPLPITLAIVAPFSGALADRIGSRWLAATGLSVASLGLVLISTLNATSATLTIIGFLVLTGVGQALFQSPNNSALMGSAPKGQQGSASGFLATGRTVGQSVSVALAGAVFTGLGGAAAGQLLIKGAGAAQKVALQNTFVNAFHVTFLVCASICALGVFASLVRGNERK